MKHAAGEATSITRQAFTEAVLLTGLVWLLMSMIGPTLGWQSPPSDTWPITAMVYMLVRAIWLAVTLPPRKESPHEDE